MNTTMRQSLFWTPRVLTMLFALFISIFALDVFSEARGIASIASALMMHLIPTLLVVALLVLAWRWEWIGAVGFVGLGALYILIFWGRFPLSVYATIAGPLLVIGTLFGFNWKFHTQLRQGVGSIA